MNATTLPAPASTRAAPQAVTAAAGEAGLGSTIALSLLPDRPWAHRLVRLLPIVAVVLAQATYAMTQLNALAWGDEGLYAYAGHREIAHILHNADLTQFHFGTYFSGAPTLYPVLSGALDGLGGLALSRDFSTLCMCGVTICVYAMTNRIYGRAAAFAAAVVYASAGSTVYLSHYATYDAPALFLLVAAATVSVLRNGWRSAALAGGMLALAVATKYAVLLWVPSALLIPVAVKRDRLSLRRAALGLTVMVLLLGGGYLLTGGSLRTGIVSTTLSRRVLTPAPVSALAIRVCRDVGMALLLCVVGLPFTVRDRRHRLLGVLLIFTALLAPLHQIQIHEETSLIKHSDFGVALAGPLIGYAVVRLPRRATWFLVLPLVAVACWLTVSFGNTYFHYAGSSNAELSATLTRAAPGEQVMSAEPTAAQYYYDHGRGLPRDRAPARTIQWLFPSTPGILNATPSIIALNNAPSGSPSKDADRRHQIALVMASSRYVLVSNTAQTGGDSKYRWYVWVRD